jgi:predicted GNAT family N-acyltransferase
VRRARGPEEVDAALALRYEVFCVEQGVPLSADRDGRDGEAEQIVAVVDDRVAGTCRLLLDGGVARLGRMVVAADLRGAGIGALLLAEADRIVASLGLERIVLHAQVQARAVYERAGYRQRGGVFMEEDIEHVTMEKRLA